VRGVEKTMLAFIAGRTTRDKEDDRPSELPGSFVRARRGKKTAGSHGTYLCGVRWRCDSFASVLFEGFFPLSFSKVYYGGCDGCVCMRRKRTHHEGFN